MRVSICCTSSSSGGDFFVILLLGLGRSFAVRPVGSGLCGLTKSFFVPFAFGLGLSSTSESNASATFFATVEPNDFAKDFFPLPVSPVMSNSLSAMRPPTTMFDVSFLRV